MSPRMNRILTSKVATMAGSEEAQIRGVPSAPGEYSVGSKEVGGDGKPILFISFPFPPENASGSWRPYFFAKYLPQEGYSVRVVASAYVAGFDDCAYVSRVPTPSARSFTMRCADAAATL